MLKKIKWIIIALIVICSIIFTYALTLLRYAETEVLELNRYHASLEMMPEVDTVISLHRFNGIESFIVANIRHESGDNIYFFVQDDAIVHYFWENDLLFEEALRVAEREILFGYISRYKLGIINETPIFEFQIYNEGVIYFVIVDALTGEVIMSFEV